MEIIVGSFWRRKQHYCWRIALVLFVVLMLRGVSAQAVPQAPLDGEKLYKQHCAQCHSGAQATRAPRLEALRLMGPQDVLDVLEVGTMKFVGFNRTADERSAIAEFVTGKKFDSAQEAKETASGRCETTASEFDPTKGPQWNGWSGDLANSRFQAADRAGLTAEQVPNLKIKWVFGFPANTTVSQPTVVGGRIFVGTQRGRVYSIDAEKGCLHWSIKTGIGVRSALRIAAVPGSNPPRYVAYFGDMAANVHAIDAKLANRYG
jgi:polyvinyl alcohol dehydrogenase (cytochrome)